MLSTMTPRLILSICFMTGPPTIFPTSDAYNILTEDHAVIAIPIFAYPTPNASCVAHLPNGTMVQVETDIHADKNDTYNVMYTLTVWTIEKKNYSCKLDNEFGATMQQFQLSTDSREDDANKETSK